MARVVTEAAPHIPSDRGSQLEREGVEAACVFLTRTVGVAAGKLAAVVAGAPEVLAVGVEELGSRAQLLRTLWRGKRSNLALVVQERPEVLCRAFFSQLGPCLDALTSLGFSRELACQAVTRYPPLVLRRRYELAAALRQAGVVPGESPPGIYKILAKYPRILSPEGCPEVRPVLRVLRECGVEGEQALRALASWPMLARVPAQRVRGAVNILRSNGFKEGDVAAVLRGFPQIAGVDVRRIKTVLSLLRAAGIPYRRVVQYPRVFLHDPANYTGPRLAYLKAHQPGRAEKLQLVSILSRSDAEFAEARGNIPLEEYLLFKDRWLSLYGHRFGLTPEQADPMRRRLRERLAEEVTGSLFSHIPWDSL